MKLSTMALATAACAAVALFPTAAWPQWGSSARYNHQGLNDRSEAVAVDIRGNIYVAGTVDTTADDGDFDVVVHSYTAAGVARSGWPKTYNGAADGDDYATSIAVDSDCNVYVAGTSWGDSTDYDFFVWKLNTDGQAVWPTSGSYTGYNFDSLGAVRTNTTTNEGFTSGFSPEHLGVKVDMAVRQSRHHRGDRHRQECTRRFRNPVVAHGGLRTEFHGDFCVAKIGLAGYVALRQHPQCDSRGGRYPFG